MQIAARTAAWAKSGSHDVYDGLSFTARQANSSVSMSAVGNAPSVSLETSVDYGKTWLPFVVGDTVIPLDVGDEVWFRAGELGNAGFASEASSDYNRFVMNGSISARGNTLSILSRDFSTSEPTLVSYCFNHLFYNCSSLVSAPDLPSKTLIGHCYRNMFYGCSNLEEAPYLPAKEIGPYSYAYMFYNCEKLRSIKMGYTGEFSSARFGQWVYGVASEGTFYYNGVSTTRGVSAIPNGWTVLPFTD